MQADIYCCKYTYISFPNNIFNQLFIASNTHIFHFHVIYANSYLLLPTILISFPSKTKYMQADIYGFHINVISRFSTVFHLPPF